MPTILFLACLLAIIPRPAHAYIDPGTGSMVFQAVIAGIVGGFFTLKMYWGQLKKKLSAFFGKKGDKDVPPSQKG
jgi:hypothetical protein